MTKKKFLFLNLWGPFLGIADRIHKEGYECFSWYKSHESEEEKSESGKGIINIVDDYFDIINQFKDHKDELIILIDDNSKGDMMDYLMNEGWNVVGSSHFSDKAEHDREFGMKLAEKIGLDNPPYKSFNDFNEGKRFVQTMAKSHPEASFVFKADGADMAGGSKTYVARNMADLLWFIEWVEKDQQAKNYKVDKFELQSKIDGVEADYASWFNGEKLLPYFAFTMEEKKIHGLGAAVGCLGQIVTFGDSSNKYYQDYLLKLQPYLAKNKGMNEWAINNIVSEKDHLPKFLEFTPRHGWDSTIGEFSILKDAGRSIGDFYSRLVEKKEFPKGYFPMNKFSAAVHLYSENINADSKAVCGKPIHWDKRIEDKLWFYNIKEEDGNCVVTGSDIGVAACVGNSVEEAVAKVYKLVSPKNNFLATPDLFYSEYIGERSPEVINKLKKWGWL